MWGDKQRAVNGRDGTCPQIYEESDSISSTSQPLYILYILHVYIYNHAHLIRCTFYMPYPNTPIEQVYIYTIFLLTKLHDSIDHDNLQFNGWSTYPPPHYTPPEIRPS